MQLQSATEKASLLPNADEIKAKLQNEYDLLVQKMGDYYAAKKQLMDMKKQKLMQNYAALELNYKYKELKQSFALQKQKWLELNQLQFQFS